MSNTIEDINIKNHTNYFFEDIDIKDFDPKNIKMDEVSYKNILIYYIAYVMIKNLKYMKFNIVNPLYLMLNKMNGYLEEINENEKLTLAPSNKSKEKLKKYDELWI